MLVLSRRIRTIRTPGETPTHHVTPIASAACGPHAIVLSESVIALMRGEKGLAMRSVYSLGVCLSAAALAIAITFNDRVWSQNAEGGPAAAAQAEADPTATLDAAACHRDRGTDRIRAGVERVRRRILRQSGEPVALAQLAADPCRRMLVRRGPRGIRQP